VRWVFASCSATKFQIKYSYTHPPPSSPDGKSTGPASRLSWETRLSFARQSLRTPHRRNTKNGIRSIEHTQCVTVRRRGRMTWYLFHDSGNPVGSSAISSPSIASEVPLDHRTTFATVFGLRCCRTQVAKLVLLFSEMKSLVRKRHRLPVAASRTGLRRSCRVREMNAASSGVSERAFDVNVNTASVR